METQFERTEFLLGKEAVAKLHQNKVIIFGVGGVGGFVTEALARTGVGYFTLVDNDTVALSNINRQIIATHDTIGMSKVEVMKKRILSINPAAVVETKECFYLPENADSFDLSAYDYVVDAIDTVSGKIELAVRSARENVRIISSMGAGNKLDPTQFEVADVFKTSVCPLAKVMRRELKKRGVKKLKVVYSKETPAVLKYQPEDTGTRRSVPGSTAFVPSVVGLIIASEIIKDLTASNTK